MISFSKKHTATLLLLTVSLFRYGQAQNAKIDSLLSAISNKADTLNVQTLNALVFEYWNYDIEQAFYYTERALLLSKNIEYKKGIAVSLTNMGLYHFLKGEYDQAMTYYKESIEILEGTIYPSYPSYTLSRIANLYRDQSQFDSAIVYYKKAIQYSSSDNIVLASAQRHLGSAYLEMEIYDSAKHHLMQSIEIEKSYTNTTFLAASYLELSKLFIELNSFDSSSLYLEKVKQTEAFKEIVEIQIRHALYSGELELIQGYFSNAIDQIKGSLELFDDYKFEDLRIRSLVLLGDIYTEIGEYDGALDNLLKAESLNRPLENPNVEGQINYTLGYVYYYQNNIQKAKEVSEKAEKLFDQLGLSRSKARTHNLLGLINLQTKDYTNAESYFNLAMELYQKQNYKKGIASVLFNKSYIYLDQGQNERVLEIQLQALRLEKEINNVPGIIISNNAIGKILLDIEKYDEAEKYLLLSDRLLQENPSPSYEEDTNLFLAELYSAKKDYKKAYKYLKQSKANSDSLYSYNSLERSLQLNAINDLEKKELEIQSLDNERKTKDFELALKENQLSLQRLLIILCGLVLLFFAFFSYFLLKTIRQLRNTQRELIKAEKRASLGILVAGLGHEINNPLNFIRGGVEGLRMSDRDWTNDEKKLLNGIETGVSRTSEILKLLNQFQRENSGKVKRFNIYDTIKASIKDLIREIPDQVKVEIDSPKNDLFVRGYENDLRQLFCELIINGIESIEKEGSVSISISSNDNSCIVQISDDGSGIKSENKAVIENPFFTTKEGSSKGFGLYLVDYILNDHHGSISFNSKKDRGTTVTVTLPKA